MYYTGNILKSESGVPEVPGYWIHKTTAVQTNFDMTAEWITGTTFNRPSWYLDASEVKVPEGITHIAGGATGTGTFYLAGELEKIFLPNSLTNIGAFAFTDCLILELSALPPNVSFIGNEAFGSCYQITISEIPDGETALRYGVFYACSSLPSLKLGPNITSIEDYALSDCTSLTTLEINRVTPPTLSGAGLNDSDNITAIKVPLEAVDAYKAASNWSGRAGIITAI